MYYYSPQLKFNKVFIPIITSGDVVKCVDQFVYNLAVEGVIKIFL